MPNPQLKVALPLLGAEGDEIQLISGHPLFGRSWQSEGNRAVVVCLHGVESHSGWFSGLAESLLEDGVDTFAYDRMGWGQSPGEDGELTSLHDIYDELCSLIYILRERYDRIHLLGMSWGGLYLLYAGHHLSTLVNSLAVVSPGLFIRNPFSLNTLKFGISSLVMDKKWRFKLAYQPSDFCYDPAKIDFVRQDPWRLTQVGPKLIGATLFMQRMIRSPFYKAPSSPVQVFLASHDRILVTQKMLDFCEDLDLGVKTLQGGHSLVLDCPGELTRHLVMADRASLFQEPLEFKRVI